MVRRKQPLHQKTEAPQTQMRDRDTETRGKERERTLSIQEWLKLLLNYIEIPNPFWSLN